MVDKVSAGATTAGRDGGSAAGACRGRRGPTPILAPTSAPHSEAASITGGYVCHGTRLPELAGPIYGDYQAGIIWGFAARASRSRRLGARPHADPSVRVRRVQHRGLYPVDHDRLTRSIAGPEPGRSGEARLPRRLSQTGLFTSIREQLSGSGVIPYSVNSSSGPMATVSSSWPYPATAASASTVG
jgi:hypothetical protein